MDDVTSNLPEHSVYEYAALAREIAMGLRNITDILDAHNLTPENYEIIKENTSFAKMLESMQREWNAITNTAERVAVEAAFTFEQGMPALYQRMVNPDEPLNHAVEAAKLFAKAGGIGEGKGDKGPTQEKFAITINLGADQQLKLAGGTEVPLIPSKLLELPEPSE